MISDDTNLLATDRRLSSYEYFSRTASQYSDRSRRGLWGMTRSLELRKVLLAMDLESKHEVLEVGTGTGFYPDRLARKVRSWVALEPNLNMFSEVASSSYSVFNRDLKYHVHMRPNDRFDRILIAGVLEFCNDANEAREICDSALKLLRPGGRLVLLVPGANLRGRFYLAWHNRFNCQTLSYADLNDTLSKLFPFRRLAAGPLADVILKMRS